MTEPPTDQIPYRLRDGSEVRIRPIRPDDRERMQAAFRRLSRESRYQRFLVSTTQLTDEMLDYLTEVDHHDHEALVALDAATGEGVGVARFVRLEPGGDAAEAAITVVDDWQGRGLGTLLLELLARRAMREGVTRFRGTLLARNTEIIDVLERLAPVRVIDRELGTVEIEVSLPSGIGTELRELLRLAS
ncbi:MAG TPA: GNAT family N-acetyltransferase, partial [Solirubrobacteraceae bacterium]|nr:GNAT family N-acetyltransferase [Solirubrobacteraceae bacterium]